MIQDSGARREFKTGAVRDIHEGKGRCDLMPLGTISLLFTEDNTMKGILEYIDQFQHSSDPTDLIYAIKAFVSSYCSDLLTLLLDLSKHFEEGAKKYGEYNWQKGIPIHCYIDSAVRHLLKFYRHDQDERHDRAFVWNLVCCIYTLTHNSELDDYTHKVGVES